MTDNIVKTADFQMLKFDQFAGSGVQVEGDDVSVAFMTDGPSIDVTMSRKDAKYLAEAILGVLK